MSVYIYVCVCVCVCVCACVFIYGASQVLLVVKNPPATAGDTRDLGSIPGSGRSPGEGPSSILTWRISWAEEPDGLCSIDQKESDTTEAT